jgi:DNA gyrase/topoisomerase IV subunit B
MSMNANKYNKVTAREHILIRPDTYVGSNELTNEDLWIYDENKNNIIKKNIKYNPAFLKIFDEALVNASDAHVNDKYCNTIKVAYNKEEGYISIWNNAGDGIPIEEHSEYKTLVPSMIFGELLTSSNYDDAKTRTGSGRNGVGIKLCNIFSTKFIVEVVDHNHKKHFIQEWTNNMADVGKASVTKSTLKNSSVQVKFYPDFKRFNIKDLDNDHYNLFYRRAIDIAGMNPKLNVYFNDTKVESNNFKLYMELHYPEETIFLDDSNERWKVGIIYKQDSHDTISFVNSINTYHGGTHVTHVTDQIYKYLIELIKKKNKDIKVTNQSLKDNLIFFINSTLENPTFSSQTKDTTTLKSEKFGSRYEPNQAFLKKLAKCGIVEQVIEFAKFKESSNLKKTDGKKQVKLRGIPKLDDANKAGSKDSYKCSLILTEGDSAKTFAVSGLSVIGRDYFGVFPLKGKLLNVREANPAQILANEEITNLKQIIGLKNGEDYSDDTKFNQLRYGRIIILTDSDVDGSHIKGLVMNFVHSIWPSLMKREKFITSMATPIVKATKGSEILSFYNLPDYDNWLDVDASHKNWKIKYYKGLGTSTAAEAREYFIDFEKKLINYTWISNNDDEETDLPYKKNNDEDAILLAFEKARADDRKVWLHHFDKDNVLLYEEKEVRISKFIHSDLIHFSNDDLSRSIPSLVDGLKPSQRKIYYGAQLRGLEKTEVKVAQLAGFVSDKAAYHHGEASLMGAIIGMAQNYMGSNNINILKPNGQFGCLSPETPILMWDNTIKRADEISIGDKLIGDDGNERNVLEITNGIDDMYKINIKIKRNNLLSTDSFTCNSQHILTLYFKENNKIIWKESSQDYHFYYFDGVAIKSISIKTCDANTKTTTHCNKSIYTKEEAYDFICKEQERIKKVYNTSEIIDIKLEDYLKLSPYSKKRLFMIYNFNCINWDKKEVPIDPYILGAWLGDGNHEGNGFTSADQEIVKEFVKWADTINCEVVHHANGIDHENYHYGLRRKNTGYRTSIGDANHNSNICEGCKTSKVKHPACNWYFKKTKETINFGQTIHGQTRSDLNPFKELLKKHNLYTNKHIPIEYLYNDKETRLQLLAGFIDTDGTIKNIKLQPYYEISQSERLHGNLIDSLDLIAKSLGYSTSVSSRYIGETKKGLNITMKTLRIMGINIDEIPCRLPRKQIIKKARIALTNHYVKFDIEYLGKDKFNGWQVDKNERFLLGNYIVTHNSRLKNGGDSASPRYIWTMLEDLTPTIFNPMDTPVLNNLFEDSEPIEPEYYVPIIPMILVNGTQGIGTGFSTKIPCYNPKDIIKNLKSKLSDQEFEPMDPWWQGFEGNVSKVDELNYEIHGNYQVKGNKLIITELPVGESTFGFKEHLEKLLEPEDAKKPAAKATKGKAPAKKVVKAKDSKTFLGYTDNSTDTKVYFELEFEEGYLETVNDIDKLFHLCKKYSIGNMHLFDSNGVIKKYSSPLEIMDEYFYVRLEYYQKRRKFQLGILKDELALISYKVKFLLLVIDKKLIINNKKKIDLEKELEELEFPKLSKNESYDYLLNMPIYNLTKEKVEHLKEQEQDKEAEYKSLKKLKSSDIWLSELDHLETIYDKWINKDKKATIKKSKK